MLDHRGKTTPSQRTGFACSKEGPTLELPTSQMCSVALRDLSGGPTHPIGTPIRTLMNPLIRSPTHMTRLHWDSQTRSRRAICRSCRNPSLPTGGPSQEQRHGIGRGYPVEPMSGLSPPAEPLSGPGSRMHATRPCTPVPTKRLESLRLPLALLGKHKGAMAGKKQKAVAQKGQQGAKQTRRANLACSSL